MTRVQGRCRGVGIRAVVLLACLSGWKWPLVAQAQPFTITQITNTTGGLIGNANFRPSINAAGTRIAFDSIGNLTPRSPGNADGNREIYLSSSAAPPTAKIPALNEWGMILLGLLLGVGMAFALGRCTPHLHPPPYGGEAR